MSTQPLANIVTLGVLDFTSERSFYAKLGWPLAFDSDDFTVFELRGILLALFPVAQLASDARVSPEPGRSGIRSSIIINVDRPEDVDETIARFRNAGATISKEPVDAEFFDGRSAYAADPEGNYWEITWAASRDSVVLAAARRAAGLDSKV